MKKVLTLFNLIAFVLFFHSSASADCPQPRKTESAPADIAGMAIPGDADVGLGKSVYQEKGQPMACKKCHGNSGAGDGKFGAMLDPKPRNFKCTETMKDISPGQMFWVIKNGSNIGAEETGMVAHKETLSDKDIWSVVKYIKSSLVK